MKKNKEFNPKVEFTNEFDTGVFDKYFYESMLNNILKVKTKDEEQKNQKESQEP